MYESPIDIIYGEMETQIENDVLKALQYDREQYLKGYEDGLNADRWIPCSERLPECEDYAETDALLFQLQDGEIEVGYFGRKNAWRDAYFRHYRTPSGVDVSVVVAWKPLPEPYKGE